MILFLAGHYKWNMFKGDTDAVAGNLIKLILFLIEMVPSVYFIILRFFAISSSFPWDED